MKTTKRSEKIAPFYVMELLEKAKAMEARGENIVHMEVGEPDFATPSAIKEKAIEAVKENRTFYTHSLGIPELRDKISEYYYKTENISIPRERIIITSGTSGAFLLLSAVLLDRRNPLGISDPGYPCYRNFALLVDSPIISIPVTEETGFEVTVEHLQRLKKLPGVLIVSTPSNPTGIVYREETMQNICQFLYRKGKVVVSDEIYKGLVYGKASRTALALSEDIVVINGFSKTHAMTGWRLGWMVVPQALVRPIQKVAQNVFISPPTISQYAAMCAFDVKNELEEMRKTYEARRDFMLPELKKMGFHIPVDPEGAFYIYAGIDRWGLDSMEFVERALNEARVALTPGYDFGFFKAGSHIRFSYANSLEMLGEGCRRLNTWLNTL
jgi:aspartate/methionine/tyrosine aminotransferase